ncbi:SDR family NAD(P)-dependent oxidoreductase, partial [Aeromonas veronii]
MITSGKQYLSLIDAVTIVIGFRAGQPPVCSNRLLNQKERPMSKSLVVITGASAGIGAAIARAFSAAGHPLLLLARRVEPMQALNLPDTL